MRARPFDPAQGRFIQRDPIGIDGGLTLYAFGDNNPIKNYDPMGLFWSELGSGIWNVGKAVLYDAPKWVLKKSGQGSMALCDYYEKKLSETMTPQQIYARFKGNRGRVDGCGYGVVFHSDLFRMFGLCAVCAR